MRQQFPTPAFVVDGQHDNSVARIDARVREHASKQGAYALELLGRASRVLLGRGSLAPALTRAA